MQLVLSTHHFSSLGGMQTYLLTVAEQLERLGHEVTITALELGEMAEVARERGIRVVRGDDLPASCDAVLVQDAVTSLALAERYPHAPQLFVVHGADLDLVLPPQLEGVVGRVVVLNERVARRVETMAAHFDVLRLRQPVDLDRFRPTSDIARRPRRVLALGNYLRGERRAALESACAEHGLELAQVGMHGGEAMPTPEAAINDADIVVGYGRSVLEGMACARAAYVFDHLGGDGWVTPDSYPALEADGFYAGGTDDVVDPARLRADLGAYDVSMGLANFDLARHHHDANRHGQALADALAELAPRAEAINAPLREMARLTRLQWQSDSRAAALALESQMLRERLAALEAERERMVTEAAQRDSATPVSEGEGYHRRYKLADRLVAPLDAARALRERRSKARP